MGLPCSCTAVPEGWLLCVPTPAHVAWLPFVAPAPPRSGALVLEGGQLMWPAPPLPAPAAPPPKKEAEAKKELTPEEIYADTLKSALTTSECSWERW